MRRTESLSSFIQAVEDRKRSSGVTDEMIHRVRNSGRRRTNEKRELLDSLQTRARRFGLKPIPAKI